MIPVLTPAEMAAVDAAATEPLAALVERAGAAIAAAAREMLGATYGKRVTAIAGKGLNGEDARVAVRLLERRGVRCRTVDTSTATLPPADLIIDGAYGTGLNRAWNPPTVDDTPVLAIDIPSGVNGLTGEVPGGALRATRTITFAALKPGLVLQPGAGYAGDVAVADIGLDLGARNLGTPTRFLYTDADARAALPVRDVAAHKWSHAVHIVGGAPGMEGAAGLSAAAAYRTGAGMVRVSSPDARNVRLPIEAVSAVLPRQDWAAELRKDSDRFGALVIGMGLGLDFDPQELRELLWTSSIPIVLDADALSILSRLGPATPIDNSRVIVTPHDGEYRRLMGHAPEADRFAAATQAADALGCVVLLKGPTTVVAAPGGPAVAVTAGDQRLATAGSGDVLAGMIGTLCSHDVLPVEAALLGAYLHGQAALRAPAVGMVASDIINHIPGAITSLRG